jgi:non-homologous end joining protein Ku
MTRTGTLTLSGLVTVPIKLYSAIGGTAPSMHLTHCGGKVTQAYTCSVCSTVVSRADCGRAVKVGKLMVPISPEDFADENGEADEGEANGSFTLIGFSASQPSQMHLGRPYYVSYNEDFPPTAYRLLIATMLERKLCALIRYMTRGVVNHGVLLPQTAGYFVLHQLILVEELRDPVELADSIQLATPEKKGLVQMGKLVGDMTVKQLPLADIKNEAASRLRSIIEAKLAEAMKKGSSKDETSRKGGKKK